MSTKESVVWPSGSEKPATYEGMNYNAWQSLEDLKQSPRARLLRAQEMGVCGWSPYPNRGGYSHWYCQRRRAHFGAHRFINYVAGRIFWPMVRYKPTMKGIHGYEAGRP